MELGSVEFSLDIGTRTVIGVVGSWDGENFKVLATEMLEHKSRSMVDGQVHDIAKVAETAKAVKESLEKQIERKLTKVSIAAAGRVLKTKQVKIDREIDTSFEIDDKIVGSLEVDAIQLAQSQLEDELTQQEKGKYYCVAYTVVNYYLNNYIMGSLLGQRGNSVGVEVIATFLPHTVVDSLYSVMKKIDLEVETLTLEPIAAINLVIPSDIRMLNLVLVDIGAGTSDIAITRGGSVAAYDMVPIAGDEITEILCHKYILDFNTAEKVKMSIGTAENDVSFVDIMGITYSVHKDELLNLISPVVENLANSIVERILDYNKRAPNAVFLVGGGSQVPKLREFIAKGLELPIERVAIRKRDDIKIIKMSGNELMGPEIITPVGIAVTTSMQRGHDFISVNLNGKELKLFNSKDLRVADALMQCGITSNDIIGSRGEGISFRLNGEEKSINGEYGVAAIIKLNEEVVQLNAMIKSGDVITVIPSTKGDKPRVKIKEIIEYYKNTNVVIKVNDTLVDWDYVIMDNDNIEAIKMELKDEINDNEMNSLKCIHVNVNGKNIEMVENKEEFIFVDVFNYIDFDIRTLKGQVVLKLNEKRASFVDIINDGDSIEIYGE